MVAARHRRRLVAMVDGGRQTELWCSRAVFQGGNHFHTELERFPTYYLEFFSVVCLLFLDTFKGYPGLPPGFRRLTRASVLSPENQYYRSATAEKADLLGLRQTHEV